MEPEQHQNVLKVLHNGPLWSWLMCSLRQLWSQVDKQPHNGPLCGTRAASRRAEGAPQSDFRFVGNEQPIDAARYPQVLQREMQDVK